MVGSLEFVDVNFLSGHLQNLLRSRTFYPLHAHHSDLPQTHLNSRSHSRNRVDNFRKKSEENFILLYLTTKNVVCKSSRRNFVKNIENTRFGKSNIFFQSVDNIFISPRTFVIIYIVPKKNLIEIGPTAF